MNIKVGQLGYLFYSFLKEILSHHMNLSVFAPMAVYSLQKAEQKVQLSCVFHITQNKSSRILTQGSYINS